MAEMCPTWSSARVQVRGLYFMTWTFEFWICVQKLPLDALKNRESGKILLYPVKQTVMLFIGFKTENI